MYFSRWEGVVRWVDFARKWSASPRAGSSWTGASVVFRVRGLKC